MSYPWYWWMESSGLWTSHSRLLLQMQVALTSECVGKPETYLSVVFPYALCNPVTGLAGLSCSAWQSQEPSLQYRHQGWCCSLSLSVPRKGRTVLVVIYSRGIENNRGYCICVYPIGLMVFQFISSVHEIPAVTWTLHPLPVLSGIFSHGCQFVVPLCLQLVCLVGSNSDIHPEPVGCLPIYHGKFGKFCQLSDVDIRSIIRIA